MTLILAAALVRYGKEKGETKQASFLRKLEKTCPIGKSLQMEIVLMCGLILYGAV